MATDAHRTVWDPGAGLDRGREATDIEAAIARALGRNGRLRGSAITASADAEGLVTLTGRVSTQALRAEVELTCWTVFGVRGLHDELIVGRRTR
jgi:osmotically-inducible protein OsmY